MNKFKIFETEQFLKDIDKNLSNQSLMIGKKLRTFVYPQLQQNPFFGKNIKKLINYKPETWRYRVGNYRFFYEIDEKNKIVFMIVADHRSKVY